MRTALPILLSALAACGGDAVLVPVTLTLDSETCTTSAPDLVALSCDSSVGVWVRTGDPEAPDTLEQACIDFASTDKTLADLPEILSTVDLSGLGGGEVWLELGVFSPSSAEQGCPEIADFSDDMVVYGETVATEIGGTSRGLMIELLCYAVDDGSTFELCRADCIEAHDYCPDAAESGTCDLEYDDCLNACDPDDDACFIACDDTYTVCLDAQPMPCGDALCPCLDGCGGDIACEDACYETYDSCIVTNCDQTYQTCLGSCSAAQDSCAAVQ